MKTSRLIFCFFVTIAVPASYAASVVINSSSAVTFLPDGTSTSTDFSSPFTTANFTSAQTGADAVVLTGTPFYTTNPSLVTAGAEWIGTSAGGGTGSTPDYTALYALSFDIPDAFFAGSLTLDYEVDNVLGDLDAGIYLNGTALPGSTNNTGCSPGCFSGLQTYTDSSIAADLVVGTNWLYIDAVNLGAEGGLIFSADISTTGATTASPSPEPSPAILMAMALLGVFLLAARNRPAREATRTNI